MPDAKPPAWPEPHSLIGTWRRFGPVGPVYEIFGAGRSLLKGGPSMRVRVVESGEELDYPLADILDDPKERPTIGSSFESGLDEEGLTEEVTAAAAKSVIAEQIAAEMKRKNPPPSAGEGGPRSGSGEGSDVSGEGVPLSRLLRRHPLPQRGEGS
ncbi:hypothetical protein HNR00_002727 [Methylorubrum rhodinum]|uniref:Uncharacterized protein n=1 Tax=Methylorubrum rhodinum TaxID=29428 RepID=A0A840ZL24_9HYPH|nr:DUF5397 family protein [Methylorubrum rhodinum]MBB5758010.1 hypothetical protein [Methylorubrum rhodinum]